MNHRRYLHQSMIIEDRYLFVFFGMKSSVRLNNSIEFMDLNTKHKIFTIAKLKNEINGIHHLFDRSLYFLRGGSIKNGLDILVLGGQRGDDQTNLGQ